MASKTVLVQAPAFALKPPAATSGSGKRPLPTSSLSHASRPPTKTLPPGAAAVTQTVGRRADQRCEHVEDLLRSKQGESAQRRLEDVVKWAARERTRSPATAGHSSRSSKMPPTCSTCAKALGRPFACLSCPFIGCFGSTQHIVSHLRSASHPLCVDSSTGTVFCLLCDDFIVSTRLQRVSLDLKLDEEDRAESRLLGGPRRKRPRSLPPVLSEEERAILARATPVSCRGPRGIRNIGQTCFLSVILQSFFHNPLLRNHFLSDAHNRFHCQGAKPCMGCEMDLLYSEFHSDDPSPFGPVTFLSSMWKGSVDLAGYAQQDAHEFFISALNQMHTAFGGPDGVCDCPIHSTFSGLLQSDVRCGSCGGVTSAFDPMLDISLDLKGQPGAFGVQTLAGCLRRYTSPERLGQQYLCDKCGVSSADATKQFSLRKLPPVLSIQLKRFEHHANTTSTKIDTPVRFPLKLDMTPYTTAAVQAAQEDELEGVVPIPRLAGAERMAWDLCAVVCHQGKLDNGHYTNFAKFKDEWYHFDDERVTRTTIGAVLDSRPYMLTYVKRHLEFASSSA